MHAHTHKGFSRSSRTLLFAETDEFGNVIDPDSGLIISRAGGHSPNFPPPWIHQTPSPTLFSLSTKIFPKNLQLPTLLETEKHMDTSSIDVTIDKDTASDSINSVKAHNIRTRRNDRVNTDKGSKNNNSDESPMPEGQTGHKEQEANREL